MNSYNVAEKTNSTGQNSLSFGANQLNTPRELLKYARRLPVSKSGKPNKGEQLLLDAFEKAIKVDKKKKNKEYIFDTAKNLLAYYMVEKPFKFSVMAEKIGGKLYDSIGEIGVKLMEELDSCLPSINIIKNISGKKPARACVDHIINSTTYKRLHDHIDLAKGVKAADNLEFFD